MAFLRSSCSFACPHLTLMHGFGLPHCVPLTAHFALFSCLTCGCARASPRAVAHSELVSSHSLKWHCSQRFTLKPSYHPGIPLQSLTVLSRALGRSAVSYSGNSISGSDDSPTLRTLLSLLILRLSFASFFSTRGPTH